MRTASGLERVLRPGRGYCGKDPPPDLRHGGRREAAAAGLPLSLPRPRPSREGRQRLPGDRDAVESDDLTARTLTKTGRGLIAAPMMNAATILIARRRRALAVWVAVCV